VQHSRTEASRDLGVPSPRRRALAEIDRRDTASNREESRQPGQDGAPEHSDRVTTPRAGDATREGGSECGRPRGEPERGNRGDAGPHPGRSGGSRRVDLGISAKIRNADGPSRRSPQTRLRTMVAPRTPGPARDRPALIGDQTGDLPDGDAPSRTRSPSPPGWRHPAPADGPPLRRPDGPRVAVLGSGLPSPCSSSRDGGSGAVAVSPGSTVNSTTAIEKVRDPPSRIRPKTPAQASPCPHNPSGERRATWSRSSHRSPRIRPRPRAAA
jgi:hypothetical protein